MPAIPLIAAGIAAGGSMYAANKQKKAAGQAAAGAEGIAARQDAAAQAERAKWEGKMAPVMAGYNQNPFSPELTAQMYDFFNKGVTKDAAIARTRLTQGMDRRGLRDSGIAGKSMADLESGLADVRTSKGLQLQQAAATGNNAAKMNLLQLLMSGYGGGQSQVMQANQIGAGLGSDALGARLAGANNYYGTLASGLGGLVGAAGQSYDAWKSNTAAAPSGPVVPTGTYPSNAYAWQNPDLYKYA